MTGCSMLLWKRGEPRNPTTTPPSASTCSRSSWTRRLLPMPGSPLITATCPAPPCERPASTAGAAPSRRPARRAASSPGDRRPRGGSWRVGLAEHDEQRHRLVDALERLGAERLDRDEPLDERANVLPLITTCPGSARLCRRDGDVRRLADDVGAAVRAGRHPSRRRRRARCARRPARTRPSISSSAAEPGSPRRCA